MRPIHWGVGLSTLCLTVLLAWSWNSSPINLRDRLFPKHLAEVYPELLYRSGQIDAGLIEPTLDDLGIDVVVDLTGDRGGRDQEAERAAVARMGIEYHSFSLGGSGIGDVGEYIGAVEAIARGVASGRPVLVHCRAGDRRTAGVVAAYQLLVRGEPPARAMEELERFARRSVEDSLVLRYLLDHLPQIAQGLEARGVSVHASWQRRAAREWGEFGVGAGPGDG